MLSKTSKSSKLLKNSTPLKTPEKRPDPTTEWEDITPEIAQKYLAMRGKQRPLNSRRASSMAENLLDPVSGYGTIQTGEAVQFDWNGALIDGQHRLMAIVKSQVPCRILVIRGLDPASFDMIDQGRRRNAGDTLAALGYPYYVEAGTIIRNLYCMKFKTFGIGQLNNHLITQFAEAHKEQINWTTEVVKGSAEVVAPGIIGAVAFLGGYRMPDKMMDFCHRVIRGIHESESDPDYVLRRKLMRLRELTRSNKRNPRRSVRPDDGIPLVITGWNAFAIGKSVTKISPTNDYHAVYGAPPAWYKTLWEGIE